MTTLPGVVLYNMVTSDPSLFRFALLFRNYTPDFHLRAVRFYTRKLVSRSGETRYSFLGMDHRPLLEGPAVESEGYRAWYHFGQLHHKCKSTRLIFYPDGQFQGKWIESECEIGKIYTDSDIRTRLYWYFIVLYPLILVWSFVLGAILGLIIVGVKHMMGF